MFFPTTSRRIFSPDPLDCLGLPRFCDFGEATGSTWSKILASTSGNVGSVTGGGGGVSGTAGGPAPIDLAYMRWLKALAAHCRNTRAETAVDADPERRRSEVRCFRTLEVKVSGYSFSSLFILVYFPFV